MMGTKVIIVESNRAFNPTKIPGADYVINQYVGCEHACSYCYAKFMCKWYSHGKWGSWLVVKENLPEIVSKEHVKGKVYMSSVSDPYQPVERKLRLTRNILKSMGKNTELSILTKSDLVLRDVDIFKEFEKIEVGLTINSFGGKLKNKIEPCSPTNEKRIGALKFLHENGIKNYAFISPIIPNLTDVEGLLKETRSFVNFYWFEFLNLRASGGEFREWLKKTYPESCDIISNRIKFEKYVKGVRETIKNSKVEFRGVCVHYPRFVVLR